MNGSTKLDGHLGEGTRVRGELAFEGAVRIDGHFEGRLRSPSTLILGPGAEVHADVEVRELVVHGTLRGAVKGAKRVTIHADGRVWADLQTDRLAVEPGAVFEGKCSMKRPPAAVQPANPAADSE